MIPRATALEKKQNESEETKMANDNKTRFIQILEGTNRPGVDKLLAWLDTTDFYTAPASTKYHGAYPGGLLEHSLHVYDRLLPLAEGWQQSTLAVVALLHDPAKINVYRKYTKNQKNKQGQWEQVEVWGYDDKFPQGHGEKSVILIMQHGLTLTDEEITAINWHMGGFDTRVKGGSYDLNGAWERFPLAVRLHIADLEATWMDEGRQQKGQA